MQKLTGFLIAIFAITLWSACTSTRVIIINPRNSSEVQGIEVKPDNKVHFTLSDGRKFTASNLQITADSTRFLTGGQFISVANSVVKKITHVRHGKGALQGLGTGLLIGGATGIFLGISA